MPLTSGGRITENTFDTELLVLRDGRPVRSGERMQTCKKCGSRIVWARNKSTEAVNSSTRPFDGFKAGSIITIKTTNGRAVHHTCIRPTRDTPPQPKVEICQAAGCAEPIYDSGYLYCSTHVCHYGGCKAPAALRSGESFESAEEVFCVSHWAFKDEGERDKMERTCEFANCDSDRFRKTSTDPWYPFCLDHICNHSDCVKHAIRPYGKEWGDGAEFYCEDHTAGGIKKDDNPKPPPEPPKAVQDGTPLSPFEQQLVDIVLPHVVAKVSEKDIAAIVRQELEKQDDNSTPRVIRIEVIRDEKEGPPENLGLTHFQVPHIIAVVKNSLKKGRKINLYFWGAPGVGKSHMCAQITQAVLGTTASFGELQLGEGSPPSSIYGFVDAGGNYRDTSGWAFLYERPGGFTLEELDNCNGNTSTTLNVPLEVGHGMGRWPHKTLVRHSEHIVFATGNTPLRGAAHGHAARRGQDTALIDRFRYVRIEYDLALERKLALGINSAAGPWVDWTQRARAYADKNNLTELVKTLSPRCSMGGAMELTLIDDTFTIEKLAEAVGFKGSKPDAVRRLIEAVPLPSVKTFTT